MTTTEDQRRTLGETYGLATQSGDLRVQEKRGDADVIMAAGIVAARSEAMHRVAPALGVTLLRLQIEFDSVRSSLSRAQDEAAHQDQAARKLERVAEQARAGSLWPPERLMAAAQAVREAGRRQAITERLFALIELKTLREAKQSLGSYAQWLATKERFMEPPAVVDKLTGRVLDVFLDPTCHTCAGTGQIGSGYQGETMRTCDTCAGTGNRRDAVGNGPRARWFAFLMLGDMQQATARAASGMGRLLRSTE